MKNRKTRIAGLLLGGALLLSLPLFAGASELTDKCDKCHGKNGNSEDPKVPTIAGFSAATLEDILNQYKNEERPAEKYKPKGGEETDMVAVSKKLSDAQIKEVAKYYAGKKFIPHKQKFDAKLAKKGAKLHDRKCEKCHSDGGSNPEDDAAILAGQWREYLEHQFALIKKREREVPKKMWKKFKKLNDEKMKELIEFYVSQQ
jgi:sulfide dehydrogenase cytochrome subunit